MLRNFLHSRQVCDELELPPFELNGHHLPFLLAMAASSSSSPPTPAPPKTTIDDEFTFDGLNPRAKSKPGGEK